MNRKTAPEVHPIVSLPRILPEEHETKSGIPIYLMRQTADDAVKIAFHFAGGKINQKSPLVASFTSDLLLSGTKTKSAKEIEESIDFLGGYTQAEMGMENTSFTLFSLVRNTQNVLEIVLDALKNVTFNEREFGNHRKNEKQHFKVSLEKVSFLARKNFIQSLYGGTVYAGDTKLTDFDKIKATDCREFYQNNIRKGLIDVYVIGNLPDDTLNYLMNTIDDWKNTVTKVALPEFTPQIGVKHEVKKDAVQTAIRIGKLLFTPNHPDYMDFKVMNTVLGGYFGSRLMANIREDKGYTYGIGSGNVSMKQTGYFFISTEVGVDVKEQTITEIRKEIDRLQNEKISEQELDLVKEYLSGQCLKNSDGVFAMMDQFLFLKQFNLAADYHERYLQKIKQITPERIKELAIKYLQWEDFSIISVG